MYSLFVAALTVGILWAARDLLLPVALALLLAFTLAPLVRGLERLRFWRIVSVLIVTVAVTAGLVLLGFFVLSEARDVARQVQQNQGNMQAKILRLLERVHIPGADQQSAVRELAPFGQLQDVALQALGTAAGALPALLGTVAVVSILAVFMLVYRENFHDRIIRLCGVRHITVTTGALDEAGSKVSRYLLMLVTTNAIHGTAVGAALFLLGVPSAALWGVFAACFRIVPYVGPVVSDLLPLTLVVATSPDWTLPIETFATLMVIELLSNNVLETFLSSRGTGVSPPAVLVAALFWGWVWGPAGLLLSMPLTVCLLVLGRHVPQLEFLVVMLSDEPVLDTEVRLYQRLLAGDIDEAYAIVDQRRKKRFLARVFGEDVLGAIRFADEEFDRNAIDDAKLDQVLDGVEAVLARLEEEITETVSPQPSTVIAVCLPAEGRVDWLAGAMLRVLVMRHGVDVRLRDISSYLGERDSAIDEDEASVVAVTAVRTPTPRRAREIEAVLQQVAGKALIAVGYFGVRDEMNSFTLGGADRVIDINWRSFVEAERSLQRLRPLARMPPR
jgi:predicted PurR-regulated permease PerM